LIPVAISIHTVTAWLFGTTLRPGWHTTIIGPDFVVGALYSGIAAVLTVMALFRWMFHLDRYITLEHFRKLSLLLLVSCFAYMYFVINEYLGPGYTGGSEQHLLSSIFSGAYAMQFWSMIVIGLFVPACILVLPRFRTVKGIVVAALLVNIGMWLKRFVIVVPTLSSPYMPPSLAPDRAMRLVTLLIFAATSAWAQSQAPVLELKTAVEDGKKMLIATVTRDGKPLEGVPISFYVDRTFGRLLIGADKTLEDGSAAVPAPEDMAAGPGGQLKITAQATLPDTPPEQTQATTGVTMRSTPDEPVASPAPTPPRIIDAQFTFKGETKMLQEQAREQRALWAPRAPLPLLGTVSAILVLVWGSYAFVVSQIIKIKQGAKL
jgi:polysulfide reductase-like protein